MVLESQWVTLYDVRRDGPGVELLFPLAGLVLVVIGLIGIRRRGFVRDNHGQTQVVRGSRGARRLLGFAVPWFLLTAALFLWPLFTLRRALDAGRYVVVEGTVDEFSGSNFLRKTPEMWTVNGHRYEFSEAAVQAGFHSLGVVRGGMHVRIADVNGTIARLEVTRQSLTGLPSNER